MSSPSIYYFRITKNIHDNVKLLENEYFNDTANLGLLTDVEADIVFYEAIHSVICTIKGRTECSVSSERQRRFFSVADRYMYAAYTLQPENEAEDSTITQWRRKIPYNQRQLDEMDLWLPTNEDILKEAAKAAKWVRQEVVSQASVPLQKKCPPPFDLDSVEGNTVEAVS